MLTTEIADPTGKRHNHMMRDTKKMLVELYGEGDALKFEEISKNRYERDRPRGNLSNRCVLTFSSS